jgi:hypothetical protein
MGVNLDPIDTEQLTHVATRSMTTGVYPVASSASPELVDARALAALFNPENTAIRLPTRGSARRTATIRIPYKLDVDVGTTGTFRAAVSPLAFGSATQEASHIFYTHNLDADVDVSTVARRAGPITTGIESFRINSMAIRFDRT